MICRAALDLADARHLGRTSRSDTERLGIKRAVARLATIAADEMSVLGNVPAARSWYSTAIAAADATGDVSLRADTRALAAMPWREKPRHSYPVARAAPAARCKRRSKRCRL
jgi:hypothetical protein